MRSLRILSMILAALVPVIFSLPMAAGANAFNSMVKIVHMRLYFENGRPKITVRERQPALFIQSAIRFRGRGLLAGYWEVDGRIVARFAQHVLSAGNATTVYQRTPRPLPTYSSAATACVRSSPGRSIPFPVAVYFVTGQMGMQPWGGP